MGEYATIKCRKLYAEYRSWAEGIGEEVMIARAFGERLLLRGVERRHRNDGDWWAGIGVRSEVK